MQESSNNKQSRNSKFSLLLTGEIEIAEFIHTKGIYCKYTYVYGPDWQQVSGIEEGISATAHSGAHSEKIILNTPLEATFTSTTPFKWPQIILTCYGPDSFGNDVIKGYGATFLPSTPGKTIRKVPMFIPQSSTMLQKIIGFFTGRYAEFVDPRIVSISDGREVTRVSTKGTITLNLMVVLKDIKKLGYDVQPQSLSRISEFPIPNFEGFLTTTTSKRPTTPRVESKKNTDEADQENEIDTQDKLTHKIQAINEENDHRKSAEKDPNN